MSKHCEMRIQEDREGEGGQVQSQGEAQRVLHVQETSWRPPHLPQALERVLSIEVVECC